MQDGQSRLKGKAGTGNRGANADPACEVNIKITKKKNMRFQRLPYIVSGLTTSIAIAIFLFAAHDGALALTPTPDATNPSNPNQVNAVTVCTPTPVGLVAWWPLDGNFLDIQSNNLSSPTGGYTFGTGEVRGALDLDGQTGYFTADTVPDPTDSFTFDAWVFWRGGTGTQQYIVARENGDSSESYALQVDDTGKLLFLMAENSPHPRTGFLQGVLKKNVWQHVAMTFSGETGIATLHVNGARLLRFRSERDFGNFPISFGGFHGSQTFNGLIDEIEIFDRALNSDEILDIFLAGSYGKCRPCAPPPTGMTAWWPLDGDLTDIQGGFNGTASGGTSFNTGEVEQAIDLDGTNGSFTANNVPDPGAAFSFDAWVFWRGGAGTIVSRSGSYRLSTDNGGTLSLVVGSTTGTASGVLPANEWSHLTITFNGSQAIAYVNGVLKMNFTSTRSFSASPLSFGSNQGTGFFNGLLDEVEIFSRALSWNEVVTIYGSGNTGKCRPSPVCYNGHAYSLTRQPGTWNEAEAEAVGAGGHLIAINNLFENDFLVNWFLAGRYGFFGNRPLWIGLTNTGNFTWTNGDPLTFTFWDNGEPGFDGPAVAANWHRAQGDDITEGAWADLPASGTGDGGATPPYFGVIEVPNCEGVPAAPVQPHPPQFFIRGALKKSTKENRDVVIVVATRDGEPVAHNTTVNFVIGGSAQVGSDYQVAVDDPNLPSGQLSFMAGESEAFVTIHVVRDQKVENNESITFTLQNGPNYTLNKNKKLTLTIVKNKT